MTTINTMQDLLQLLRDQPQWAEELRGILLSNELKDLPAAVRELAKAVHESNRNINQRLGNLESDTAQLKADMTQVKGDTERLQADMNQVKGDMDRLRGAEYERRAEDRAIQRALTQMDFVQPRIVKGPRSGLHPGLSSMLARARNQAAQEARPFPQPSEGANFLNADIIIADLGHLEEDDGRTRPDTFALFEASITADSNDVTRARQQAQSLAETLNVRVIAAVMADNAPDQVLAEADTSEVRLYIAPEH